nr:unnamed protein product [Callosobruchus chinensis]
MDFILVTPSIYQATNFFTYRQGLKPLSQSTIFSELKRVPRSPTLLGKRHGGLLHGGLLGHGGGGGGGPGGQYVTNINNYGPSHAGAAVGPPPHHVNYGHGNGKLTSTQLFTDSRRSVVGTTTD